MTKSPSDQLDLFAPASRVTTVIVFPLFRIAADVRAAAVELLDLPLKADREKAWTKIRAKHSRRLAALGLPADMAARELSAFRTAVACEARRRVILGIDRDGRGAA